jgi:hypothetical protein
LSVATAPSLDCLSHVRCAGLFDVAGAQCQESEYRQRFLGPLEGCGVLDHCFHLTVLRNRHRFLIFFRIVEQLCGMSFEIADRLHPRELHISTSLNSDRIWALEL